MNRTRAAPIKLLVASAGLAASTTFAQGASIATVTYPHGPIRLIVPFGPGGGSDYVGPLIELQRWARVMKEADIRQE